MANSRMAEWQSLVTLFAIIISISVNLSDFARIEFGQVAQKRKESIL